MKTIEKEREIDRQRERETERNQENSRDRHGSSRLEWEALELCGKLSNTSFRNHLKSDCCIKKLLDLAFQGKRVSKCSQNQPRELPEIPQELLKSSPGAPQIAPGAPLSTSKIEKERLKKRRRAKESEKERNGSDTYRT